MQKVTKKNRDHQNEVDMIKEEAVAPSQEEETISEELASTVNQESGNSDTGGDTPTLPISDLSQGDIVVVKTTPKPVQKPGEISLVYTEKNGVRMSISYNIRETLGFPEDVRVAYTDKEIIIQADEGEGEDEDDAYTLKEQGRKGVIYSKELVRTLIDNLNLDFAKKTTYTMYDVHFEMLDGVPIARVPVVSEAESSE